MADGKKWASDVHHEMSGGSDSKPEKKLSHVEVHKAKSGGHVITHHHTHPEHHPSEQHVTGDDKAMQDHMMASMGDGASPTGDPTDPSAQPDSPAAAAGAATGDPSAAAAAPAAGAPAPAMPAAQ